MIDLDKTMKIVGWSGLSAIHLFKFFRVIDFETYTVVSITLIMIIIKKL